jgi:hypothetical protein
MSGLTYIGVQSVLIPRTIGSEKDALRLLSKLRFDYIKLDISGGYYRFRQFNPPDNTNAFVYRTVDSAKDPRVKLIQLFRRVN